MDDVTPNWRVYEYVLLLFKACDIKGYEDNSYYNTLCDLAETLELPANSPVHNILAYEDAPTEEQVKLVAMILSKRAVELNIELD